MVEFVNGGGDDGGSGGVKGYGGGDGDSEEEGKGGVVNCEEVFMVLFGLGKMFENLLVDFVFVI